MSLYGSMRWKSGGLITTTIKEFWGPSIDSKDPRIPNLPLEELLAVISEFLTSTDSITAGLSYEAAILEGAAAGGGSITVLGYTVVLDGDGSVSQSVTIPADTNYCVAIIGGWAGGGQPVASSMSLAGTSMSLIFTADGVSNGNGIRLFGGYVSTSGSQTYAATWDKAWAEGGQAILVFCSGVHPTTPVRDSDGEGPGDFAQSVSKNLSTIAGDMCIGGGSSYNDAVILIDVDLVSQTKLFEENASAYQSNYYGAAYKVASGTSTSMQVDGNYTGAAMLALIPAPAGGVSDTSDATITSGGSTVTADILEASTILETALAQAVFQFIEQEILNISDLLTVQTDFISEQIETNSIAENSIAGASIITSQEDDNSVTEASDRILLTPATVEETETIVDSTDRTNTTQAQETEENTANDSSSTQAVFQVTETETETVIDNTDRTISTGAEASDSNTVVDSTSAGTSIPTSQTDDNTVTDEQIAGASLNDSREETSTIIESSDRTMTTIASNEEPSTIIDAASSQALFGAATQETVTADDLINVQWVTVAIASEDITISDSESANANFQSTISEDNTATEQSEQNTNINVYGTVAESESIIDTESNNISANASNEESATLVDSQVNTVATQAVTVETLSASDMFTAQQLFGILHPEGANADDNVSNYVFAYVTVVEAASATDESDGRNKPVEQDPEYIITLANRSFIAKANKRDFEKKIDKRSFTVAIDKRSFTVGITKRVYD